MAPTCSYFQCKSVTGQKPLFRFPTLDSRRLWAWIDNCGNAKLNHLPKEVLSNKYICIDHFEQRYIQNKGKRTRLSKLAVPIHHAGDVATEPSPGAPVPSTSQGFHQTRMNEAEKKRLAGPAVRYGIFQNCMTKLLNKDGITSQPEDCQDPDLMVRKPNKVYHNYHKQICAELAKESNRSNDSNDRKVENYCTECERPIQGCQWWCLQCSGVRCGKCAVRMSHRPHYILRAPAESTREQTKAVLDAIRRHMSVDFFKRRPSTRHVDENGVDLTAIDELEVKAEPLKLDDDPFDPFACNPLEDPLAESKPVVQDIPLAEPSIDCPQSPINRDETDQNSPLKPLGVDIYSPAHPGLETYELSLAQCSGIDDFMCSGRILIDSQSIDHSEGQNSNRLDYNQSSDDDYRPHSIHQPRVPTRFKYGEDNSEDSLEAIKFEQSYTRIDVDTEQGDDQIRRPWVQVLSSQEQNSTVKIIQHKTQQKRLLIQPPPSKEQNILAKQQNIQTKRPWVQVFSNTEQKSTDTKQKNHNISEQSHVEDICEEQSSTVTEIQDCHGPLQQSEDNIEEQVPTTTDQNSVGEKQTSTATAKRKRKIIIIKKRHYICGVEREFTEPCGDNIDIDNNIQCARKTDTDVNTTTGPTNTLFNLDNKKIVTAKKRPRTQYATHIQRDFPELDDNIDIDSNIQIAREDTLNLNMTSEVTNTLLNLDEYIRDRVLEYPPNIEELM